MQYRSINPEGRQSLRDECFYVAYKARDWLIAHCFYGHNKHVFSPQELCECLPSPSGTV